MNNRFTPSLRSVSVCCATAMTLGASLAFVIGLRAQPNDSAQAPAHAHQGRKPAAGNPPAANGTEPQMQNGGLPPGGQMTPNGPVVPQNNYPGIGYPAQLPPPVAPGPPPNLQAPPNPVIMVDPVNKGNNETAYYDAEGRRRPGQTTPAPALQDYRLSPFPQNKQQQQLPYFGYDYFKPAQDLIEARRAFLLQRAANPIQQPQGFQNPGQPNGLQPGVNQPNNQGGLGQPNQPGANQPGGAQVTSPFPQNGQGNPQYPAAPNGQGYPQYPSAPNGQGYPQNGQQYPQYPTVPQSGQGDSGQSGPGYAPFPSQQGGQQYTPYTPYLSPQGGQISPYAPNPLVPRGMSGSAGALGLGLPTFTPPQPGYGYGPTQYPGGVPPMPVQVGPNAQQQYPPNSSQASIFGQGAAASQNGGVPPTQDQTDIYANRLAGPLDLMSFLPSGGAVPQTYQLAAGDTVTVRIWSPTLAAQEITARVDQTGTLVIPGIGAYVVRGQTIDQAEHALRERVRGLYRNGDVSVTLKQQRTMVVTIGGEAYLPGSYLVPASQTAYNVLYAGGGPTTDGTLRSVEVRRNGVLVGTLDLYQFLLVGGKSHDIPLQPGDVINVPSRYSSVAITGEVRKQAIFELMPDENLKDGLKFAGGVKPSGVSQRVQINTVDPGVARVLRDINIKDAAQVAKTPLYDGDEVDVFSVRDDLANRVTVEGAVDQPGDYAMSPGMKVADLISHARGTRYNAFTHRADLYRWNADNSLTLTPINLDKAMEGDPANNVSLVRWDRLKIYGRDEMVWNGDRQVTVRGAVQREGIYYRSDNLHVSDLLRTAGGPLPDAYLQQVVLIHQHPDGTFAYQFVDAGKADGYAKAVDSQDTVDPAQDPPIQDNDVLAVYRNGEAHFLGAHTVTIDGEVVTPGVYPRGDGMHLTDLLKVAGGVKPNAGAELVITHPNTSVATKTPGLPSTTVTFGSDRSIAPDRDIELHDGDVVAIQGVGGYHEHIDLVHIDGQVNRPGPVALVPGMRLSDLVRAAGGLMPDAFVEGAEFYRDPFLLSSSSQRAVATLVDNLNDLLNGTDYQRALAISDIDKTQAAAGAVQGNNSGGAAIPGLTGSAAPPTNSMAAQQAANDILRNTRDLVSQPRKMTDGELQPAGNMAVDVASALRHPKHFEDVLLQPGDTIHVPTAPTVVLVAGAVVNARGVLFKPGAGLDYYTNQAGGFAPDAARDRIEVIHPGGGLVPANKVHVLHAGDLVLVPTKVLAARIETKRNTLDDILKTVLPIGLVAKLFGL